MMGMRWVHAISRRRDVGRHTHWRVSHMAVAMRGRIHAWAHVMWRRWTARVSASARTRMHHTWHCHWHSSPGSCYWRWHRPHAMGSWTSHRKFPCRRLSLPSLFCHLHGHFSTALIFDFPTFVDKLLRPGKVHTVCALAL
jgi:hypothetical protein